MSRKIKIILLIFSLFLFNYFYILIWNQIKCSNFTSSIINRNTNNNNNNNNKITISLDIMDIYRLDISCDYIKTALGQEISTKYSNNKKCSYSSLNSNKINNKVFNSILITNKTDYKIYLNNNNNKFEPFTSNKLLFMQQFIELKPGGLWQPTLKSESNIECNLNDLDNIVFIVPFSRSRILNLNLFLINMHSYLQTYKYKFSYRILVVEQKVINNNVLFNKGRLINTAVKYVLDNYKQTDCIVLHDVDLIPNNLETNDYRCRQMPWHLSNKVHFISTNQVRVYNQFLTGGVLALRPDHLLVSNGFSNMYFGWGGEDDSFTLRLFQSGLCIMRPVLLNDALSPFLMLSHASSKQNKQRFDQLINTFIEKDLDGLNNIENLTRIDQVELYSTFTHLLVSVII
jgi:hypothetical protein